MSMGYTGHAFLGAIPTDQWIVEKLTGISYDRTRKPPAIRFGGLKHWLDIGRSLQCLKDSLDSAERTDVQPRLRDDWLARPFDLLVTGWQWNKKGRTRPILASLSKLPNSASFELKYEPRHWYFGGRFMIGAAPAGNICNSKMQSLKDELPSKSTEEKESLLVETIREISVSCPLVGPNCMSILLLPPSLAKAHIRYIPVTSAYAVISGSQPYRLKVAFSPWLVGLNTIIAPSIMSGSWNTSIGPYSVFLHAPENPKVRAVFSGQERPIPP